MNPVFGDVSKAGAILGYQFEPRYVNTDIDQIESEVNPLTDKKDLLAACFGNIY